MANSSPLADLLLRWEDLRRQGQPVSAEELCRDSPELLTELKWHIQALSFLDPMLAGAQAAPDPDATQTWTATADGATRPVQALVTQTRYELVRFHARGGLGEVLLARDAAMHRAVALKRMQPRPALHPESRGRFLAEAEITGRLEHPGIVPVYGQGTEPDGRPFYVMRFIEGQTLAEAIRHFHAAPARAPGAWELGLRHLLGQFLVVCNTIAYAHSRGVLHRDLKPANILLGKYGETLVVDWGLVKSFDAPADRAGPNGPLAPSASDSGTATQTGERVGTPAYMSPEQAAGDGSRISPASDLFGLGATLYCVLTGRAPFEGDTVFAVLDRAARADFPPPRRVNPAIPRPLEAICVKAMAYAPADRYAGALDLAADLEHWLAGEPVAAWPERWYVKARRWLARHRTLVTAGAATLLVALLSLASIALVLTEANRRERAAKNLAEEQRDKSRRNFELAREAVDRYYNRVSENTLLNVPRMKPLREQLLRTALEFHEKFLQEAGDDPAVRAERALATMRLADIRAELGAWPAASELYQQAAAVLEELAGRYPDVTDYPARLAECHQQLASVYADLGRNNQAESEAETARDLFARLADAHSEAPAYRSSLAACHMRLGFLYKATGRADRARAAYETALGLYQKAALARPEDERFQSALAQCQQQLAGWYDDNGRRALVEPALQAALAIRRRLAQAHPEAFQHQDALASVLDTLGTHYQDTGPPARVVPSYQEALALRRKLVEAHPEVPEYQIRLVSVHNNLAAWYHKTGQKAEAEAGFLQALAGQQKLADAYPEMLHYQRRLAVLHDNLGLVYMATGQAAKAEPCHRRALALQQKFLLEHPEMPVFAIDLGGTYGNLGNALTDLGKPEAALECYGQAIRVLEAALPKQPHHPGLRQHLTTALALRAEALTRLKRHGEALRDWDFAIPLADGAARLHLEIGRLFTVAHQGDHAQAVAGANALAGQSAPAGDALYRLAEVCAASAGIARDDRQLAPKDRNRRVEQYGRRAVEFLAATRSAGYFQDPAHVKELHKDRHLDVLRQRDDFRSLLAGLR